MTIQCTSKLIFQQSERLRNSIFIKYYQILNRLISEFNNYELISAVVYQLIMRGFIFSSKLTLAILWGPVNYIVHEISCIGKIGRIPMLFVVEN